MAENNQQRLNLRLILPIALLLVELIVVIVLLVAGYEITTLLTYFFILLAVFLIYQIGRQLILRWRIQRAITKIEDADKLAQAGHTLDAIRLWKSLLFSLPRDHFLSVLSKMKGAYQNQGMEEAVQQINAIHSESVEYFQMINTVEKPTPKDRRDWQARAFELQNMIKALPTEPGQDLSDTKPENE